MKHLLIKFIPVIAFAAMICCCANSQSFTNVDTRKFSEIIQQEDMQLVDVRTPEEYAEGHLEGAVNINLKGEDFVGGLQQLDKLKPIAVYCRSGRRSASAAEIMVSNGFSPVYNLNGGIIDWEKQGLPIVK